MTHCSFDIRSWCRITNDTVVLDNLTIIYRNGTAEGWLSEIYRTVGIQYPAFFKMDNLCKAGFLAAELLLGKELPPHHINDRRAIVLINRASSLDDDRRYQTTIQDADNYYPRPAIFVYTLANIVTGEIAIRHKIGGESSFFVFPSFSAQRLTRIAEATFKADPETDDMLCGWTDYDNGNCDILMLHACRTTRPTSEAALTSEIENLYNTI